VYPEIASVHSCCLWKLLLYIQTEKKISPSSGEHLSEEGRKSNDEKKTYNADDVSFLVQLYTLQFLKIIRVNANSISL